MKSDEVADGVLNIRPAIVIFFGEDAFACRESYSDLLGSYADVQRIVKLCDTAGTDEWQELLQEAFQLFTAVSMKNLVNTRLISDAMVESVPVYIVVRDAIEKFAALIQSVITCAESENLAEKLQFLTITDVNRSEELRNKAAMLHRPVNASKLSRVALQNTILAISDYWQGGRIGSNEQTQLALARITALLGLSEYSLEEGHLGFLKNGVVGGRTFWVGLGSHSVDRMDICAREIYAELLKDAIVRMLASNPKSIIGELQESAYAEILRSVAKRIGRQVAPGGCATALSAMYANEVVPPILRSLCSKVRTKDELLAVLESLAERLRAKINAPVTCTAVCAVPFIMAIGSQDASIVAVAAAGAAIIAIAWFYWRRRATTEARAMLMIENGELANVPVVPYDPVLADVLDDLRRELISKLPPNAPDVIRNRSESTSDDLLIGERRLSLGEMFRSESARRAGATELGNTPEALVLLALESGRWRTPETCSDLLATQKRVVDTIEVALRTEFVESVLTAERQRLTDKAFVQEVLYAPPPPAGAAVFPVGIASLDCPLPQVPAPVDRTYLSNCFHFLYLVEANVSS